MRLCLITRGYAGVSPTPGGGIGTRYSALGPELVRRGHETHVVTAGAGGSTQHHGVQAHMVPERLAPRFWFAEDLPWSVAAARRALSLGRFDAIFAPEWGAPAWHYARSRRAGPLITNLTTSMEQMIAISPGWGRTRTERVGNALQARLERAQAERSDGIVACSRAILSWARELWHLDGRPQTVLPNFIDVERVRRLARGPLPEGFPQSGPVVAFSGRLELRKGVHVLGEAMKAVWRRRPDAHLVLLGADARGGMSRRLRWLSADHADRLHLLGDQPPERLFPAVAAADVVALPSLWEAFGLVALEAMALGRPCVLTSGSGFEDFFTSGEHGLLVAPGDAAALAEGIERLLDDPEFRDRCGAAAAETADDYAVGAVVPRYVDFFQRVAGTA